jgi:hypothetical protein
MRLRMRRLNVGGAVKADLDQNVADEQPNSVMSRGAKIAKDLNDVISSYTILRNQLEALWRITDVTVKGDKVKMPEPRGACQRMTTQLVVNCHKRRSRRYADLYVCIISYSVSVSALLPLNYSSITTPSARNHCAQVNKSSPISRSFRRHRINPIVFPFLPDRETP